MSSEGVGEVYDVIRINKALDDLGEYIIFFLISVAI